MRSFALFQQWIATFPLEAHYASPSIPQKRQLYNNSRPARRIYERRSAHHAQRTVSSTMEEKFNTWFLARPSFKRSIESGPRLFSERKRNISVGPSLRERFTTSSCRRWPYCESVTVVQKCTCPALIGHCRSFRAVEVLSRRDQNRQRSIDHCARIHRLFFVSVSFARSILAIYLLAGESDAPFQPAGLSSTRRPIHLRAILICLYFIAFKGKYRIAACIKCFFLFFLLKFLLKSRNAMASVIDTERTVKLNEQRLSAKLFGN